MRNVEKYIRSIKDKLINETIAEKAEEIFEKITADEFDYVQAEGEMCECGSPMVEGECKECGKVYENETREGETCEACGGSDIFENECMECGKMYENSEVLENDMEEGHIYELEIEEEEDMREGNAFGAAVKKAKEEGKDEFKVGSKTYPVKNESVLYRLSDDRGSELFTENEIIDLIENIVLEEKKKSNIKKGPSPVGLSTYEKVHKGSGKESDDYLKSVMKKLKDYLKDGSKGKFEMEPKKFPKGNGELEKMQAKKYTMSDDGKEFLDDFMHPGMEDLVPDEIQYDDEWVDDLIGGSSRTGNNPEWANAEETPLGDKLKKKRKAKKFKKAKDMAYRKSPQPVTDGTGENGGSGIDIKTESVNEKQQQQINEEFTRIHQLMNYSKSTQ